MVGSSWLFTRGCPGVTKLHAPSGSRGVLRERSHCAGPVAPVVRPSVGQGQLLDSSAAAFVCGVEGGRGRNGLKARDTRINRRGNEVPEVSKSLQPSRWGSHGAPTPTPPGTGRNLHSIAGAQSVRTIPSGRTGRRTGPRCNTSHPQPSQRPRHPKRALRARPRAGDSAVQGPGARP